MKRIASTAWSGIKTGGGWVWSASTTVGGALQTAASQTWNGATVLGGWIQQGAAVAAEKTVESMKRNLTASYTTLRVSTDMIRELGLGVYDGAKIMGEGVADIARGNIKDGVTALFVGLAKLSVEAPMSTITSSVMIELSAIQSILFLEPLGRRYTPEERAHVDWVFFNNSPWWAGHALIKQGFSGIWSASSRPFTLKYQLMLKNNPATLPLVIHESTHVWQWWNGGSDYILDSIYHQGLSWLGGANAYNWQPSVNSGTQWPGLNAEQQASFIELAYFFSCYAFTGCSINTAPYDSFFLHADHHVINGWGAP